MTRRKSTSNKGRFNRNQTNESVSQAESLPSEDLNQPSQASGKGTSAEQVSLNRDPESASAATTIEAKSPDEGVRTVTDVQTEMPASPDISLQNAEGMIGEHKIIPVYLYNYYRASEEFHQANYAETVQYCDILLDIPSLPSLFRASTNLLLAAADHQREEHCIAEAERVITDVRRVLSDDPSNAPTHGWSNLETLEHWLEIMKEEPASEAEEKKPTKDSTDSQPSSK